MSLPFRKTFLRGVNAYLERSAERRIHAHPGLWPLLEEYLVKSRSTGCQFGDYDVLYRTVRRRRPSEVLECGTGVSTLVIAFALLENAAETGQAVRVTSMEDVSGWYEMARALLPERFREVVDLRLSPRVEDVYSLFRGVRYAEVPERAYELVFVDGPSTKAPSDGERCCQLDLLRAIERSERPIYGIIDSKLTTCYVMQKVLGEERVRYDAYRNLGYVGPCTREDLRTIRHTSSKAIAKSLRAFRSTRLHLEMEKRPPTR